VEVKREVLAEDQEHLKREREIEQWSNENSEAMQLGELCSGRLGKWF
jgi:hypothetical protein